MAQFEVLGVRDGTPRGEGWGVEGGGGGDRFLEVMAFFSPLGCGTISGRSLGLPDCVYRGEFERNVRRRGGR